MKKMILTLLVICSFAFPKKADAFLPVFDAAAIAQSISTNITKVDQAVSEVAQIKKIREVSAVLGGLKKGLSFLSSLKAKVDELLGLFTKGMNLIRDAATVASNTVSYIAETKELMLRPITVAKQAVTAAEKAWEFMNSGDEYLQKFKDTNREYQEIMMSRPDTSGDVFDDAHAKLDKAQDLVDQAREYQKISRDFRRKANEQARKAEELLRSITNMYRDLIRLNIKIAKNQEKACMLKVRGKQFKAAFVRAFCDAPMADNAALAVAKRKCDEAERDANQEAEDTDGDVCRTKSAEAMKRIKEFDELVRAPIDTTPDPEPADDDTTEEKK